MSKLTKREYRQLAHKHHTRRGKKPMKRPDPVETAEILTEVDEVLEEAKLDEVEEGRVELEAPMSYGSIDGES